MSTSNAVTWAIEPAHTHIGFSVRHLGLTSTPGVFKQFAAQVELDEDRLEDAKVNFEVEVASLDTALEIRDEHLRGADWFDAATHPKAVFASRAVRRTGEDTFVIEGDLTFRGIAQPVSFDAALTGRAVNPWSQKPVLGFEATGSISRSAFGMGLFPGALADDVRLSIQIELTHAS